MRRKSRTNRTLILVSLLFFLSWAPINVFNCISDILNTGKVAESLDNIVVSTNVSDEFCPEELSLNRCSEDFIENVIVVSDKNFDGNENTAKEEIKKKLSSFGIEVQKVESLGMDESQTY